MNNKRLGAIVKQSRGELSLRDFAEKCGISHTHLDSIEKGHDPRTGKPVSISIDTIRKLSNGTGIPESTLFIVALEEFSRDNPTPTKESQERLDKLLGSLGKKGFNSIEWLKEGLTKLGFNNFTDEKLEILVDAIEDMAIELFGDISIGITMSGDMDVTKEKDRKPNSDKEDN